MSEFTRFCWDNRHYDAFKDGVREWAHAYTRDLLPRLPEQLDQIRMRGKLDGCGQSGWDSGWQDAAEVGKDLKGRFVKDGFTFEEGYWPAYVATQLSGHGAINAALNVAWAMRRAAGLSHEQLLTDLQGHMARVRSAL